MKEPLFVERIAPVSREEFYNSYVKKSRPVIISSLINEWEASSVWDFDYFQQQYGSNIIQAYRLNAKGECEVDTQRGSATQPVALSECIESINESKVDNGWAVASPVNLFPTKLSSEFDALAYCVSGKYLRSMIFLGPTGVVSPLHQDLPENIYVMVKGKKRITLFAPSDSVYPNSRLSNLPNHSQINAELPDYLRFPKLKNAQPYIADVSAGDTLFIPSLWWHHLRNMESSIALNFWWSQGWKLPIAWAAAMYKKAKGI